MSLQFFYGIYAKQQSREQELQSCRKNRIIHIKRKFTVLVQFATDRAAIASSRVEPARAKGGKRKTPVPNNWILNGRNGLNRNSRLIIQCKNAGVHNRTNPCLYEFLFHRVQGSKHARGVNNLSELSDSSFKAQLAWSKTGIVFLDIALFLVLNEICGGYAELCA